MNSFITNSVEDLLNDCNKLKVKDDKRQLSNDTLNDDDDSQHLEEDDYEYDVPENNKPLVLENSLTKTGNLQVTTSYSDNQLSKNLTNKTDSQGGTGNSVIKPPSKTINPKAIANAQQPMSQNLTNTNNSKHASFTPNTTTTTSSSSSSSSISISPLTPTTVTTPSTSIIRKSNSPTIDSGISSSSLVSLNEATSNSNSVVHHHDQIPPPLPKSKIPTLETKIDYNSNDESNNIEKRLTKINNSIRESCKILLDIQETHGWRELKNLEKTIKSIKMKFFEIKTLLNEYSELIMNIKKAYFNKSRSNNGDNLLKYNELCVKLSEFMQKFNSNLNILNTLNWDLNILASNASNNGKTNQGTLNYVNHINDELDENILRLNYLIELVQLIHEFHYQYGVFSGSNSGSNQVDTKQKVLVKKQPQIIDSDVKRVVPDNDNDDYAEADDDVIDSEDDIYENDDEEWLKNDGKHNNKPTIVTPQPTTNTTNLNSYYNFSDQMLIKFYSKHIDDNFNDIKHLYELLNKTLTTDNSSNVLTENYENCMDLANKLALSGHKLVFICDTLNRNLIDISLKSSLNELSNNLGDSLKLYIIRIKAINIQNVDDTRIINNSDNKKSNFLIIDSLGQVYDCAFKLKQLIIKYL